MRQQSRASLSKLIVWARSASSTVLEDGNILLESLRSTSIVLWENHSSFRPFLTFLNNAICRSSRVSCSYKCKCRCTITNRGLPRNPKLSALYTIVQSVFACLHRIVWIPKGSPSLCDTPSVSLLAQGAKNRCSRGLRLHLV